MIRMLTVTLLALACLGLSACPPKNGSKSGSGDGSDSAPTATPTASEPNGAELAEEGETVIRYHWSGGLSTFEFYTMTLTDDGETVTSEFVLKPVKGEKRTITEELPRSDYENLLQRFEQAQFTELKQKPRGMKIFDIGRTVITYDPEDAKATELYENPDTVTTGDLKKIKAWFDERVRDYLEDASRPEEETAE